MKQTRVSSLSRISEQWRFVIAMCASNSVSLSIATLVAFWASRNVSLEEGLWLQAIFSAAIVALEVPTGYFADIFSRRISLAIGMGFLTVGQLVYCFGEGFYSFLTAELVFAVGASFLSGADEAYLRGLLKANGQEHAYRFWWGRTQAIGHYAGGILTVVGGLLSLISLATPFLVASVVSGIGFILILSLSEARSEQSPPRRLRVVAQEVLHRNKRLRWLCLASGLMWATLGISFWQFQSIFEQLGVPLAANGTLLFLYSAITGSAAWYAGKCRWAMASNGGVAALLAVAGLLAFSAGWLASLGSIVVLAALQAVRGMWGVRLSAAVQGEVAAEEVATARSVMNMASRFVFGAATVPAAYIVAQCGPATTLVCIGVFGLCSAGLLISLRGWYQDNG